MDIKEILKIESKKNNDDYVNQSVMKSNWIALMIAFAIMFVFMVYEFSIGEPFDMKPLIIMAGATS